MRDQKPSNLTESANAHSVQRLVRWLACLTPSFRANVAISLLLRRTPALMSAPCSVLGLPDHPADLSRRGVL